MREKGSWFKLLLLILGCGTTILLPVYFIWHPFPPKSFIPLLIGIIGSVMIASGVIFYALRKRISALKKLGRMTSWLNFHIMCCLLGPLLVVYHSAFTVKAPNSAIALYSMLIVVASGVVGQYLFRHFQFSLSGERATLKEMNEETDQLNQKVQQYFSEPQKIIGTIKTFFAVREWQKSGGLVRSFYTMVRLDWLERKLKRQIQRYLASKPQRIFSTPGQGPFENLLIERISLEKKIFVLEAATRLFSFWHKLHVPLVWILIMTFIVHVTAVLIF